MLNYSIPKILHLWRKSMSIFAPLFDVLNQSNIRYVVVDGLAAVLHGYVRLTVDFETISWTSLRPD